MSTPIVPPGDPLTEEQQQYIAGLASGLEVARAAQALKGALGLGGGGAAEPEPTGPDAIHHKARARIKQAGGKLTAEEQAKAAKNPLDMWDELEAHAAAAKFPKGTDVFLFKYHGMFHVAPAQNSFMCRLRIPNGILDSRQFRGVADLAEAFGGGYTDVTTRANLQIREIGPTGTVPVITGLIDLGLTARGSGADNIRNVTGSPTAGIDPQEVIDTRPLAKAWHHYILNHREMYGLPRKFNVAFDGGGVIGALEDTNDIGFAAVRVAAGKSVPEGVYFRLQIGGITGHKDFARDVGILLKPEECVAVSAALVRVFIEHGDRTDRRKARLKYLIDAWGMEKYLAEAEKHLGYAMARVPLDQCEPRGPIGKHAHVGTHKQRQDGLNYVGVVLPVGRMSVAQMRGLADLSDRYGSGTIRLTVWQNLLISDVKDADLPALHAGIEALGLAHQATAIRGALIACTGSKGCKFAAADTKGDALALADYLEGRIVLDQPINIHLTGCHHSCAQHYIGDIGLIGARVEVGDAQVDGYTVCLGGGYGAEQAIAREVVKNVASEHIPPLIEALLRAYLERRQPGETFVTFANRHEIADLQAMATPQRVAAE